MSQKRERKQTLKDVAETIGKKVTTKMKRERENTVEQRVH